MDWKSTEMKKGNNMNEIIKKFNEGIKKTVKDLVIDISFTFTSKDPNRFDKLQSNLKDKLTELYEPLIEQLGDRNIKLHKLRDIKNKYNDLKINRDNPYKKLLYEFFNEGGECGMDYDDLNYKYCELNKEDEKYIHN